ncbi:LytTR family DNA-binding domain-containing protein [Chryseobacterium herbae]|uniref:LytTR family transcriptional regulator n=1 Tax=Chryseobacterium herbae TaxID=2976476 RepID=A0ABT2ISN7_9FLAO|nr:LytTR family DNA-binding domain-containing protein [Chryseobacterium sp. pc1-10]MCT2561838.1 LytTR family transcriptional regulator [Chryseobacterium sp. pc1-10]
METIAYNNKKLRIICAFVASFYILFHGRPINLVEAFTSPGFYVALSVSFSISLLLVYAVHAVTTWLDKRSSWRSEPVKRSLLQFLLGIILPASADLLLISIYFHAIGQNIIDNGFLLIDFPVIFFFITLMNLYYLIHYLLLTEPKVSVLQHDQDIQHLNDKKSAPTLLTVDHNGRFLRFNAAEDIFYFCRQGKYVRLITFYGEEYPMDETLGSLIEQFKDTDFLPINRSVILNLTAVREFTEGEKRHTLELVFKDKFKNLLEQQGMNQFVVTKEHISKIKKKLGSNP